MNEFQSHFVLDFHLPITGILCVHKEEIDTISLLALFYSGVVCDNQQ